MLIQRLFFVLCVFYLVGMAFRFNPFDSWNTAPWLVFGVMPVVASIGTVGLVREWNLAPRWLEPVIVIVVFILTLMFAEDLL